MSAATDVWNLPSLPEGEPTDAELVEAKAREGVAPDAGPTKLDQLRTRMLSSDDLDTLPAPQPLIDGVLWRDSLVELWGKPGSAKTFVALDWALCIATGKPWQEQSVTRGHVLYIVGEGVAGLGKRRRAWSASWKQPDTSGITWLRNAVPLMEPGWVEALAQAVANLKPALIVVDTLSRAIAGHNENAPETMSAVVAASDRIREAAGGACVLFVHHATKDGNTNRGHSALEGACDVRWKVDKDGPVLTLSNPKSKDELSAADRSLALAVIDLGVLDHHGRPITSCIVQSHHGTISPDQLTGTETRLITVMRDSFGTTGATGTQLLEVSAIAKSSFYRALNALAARGALTNTGTGQRAHWHLAPTIEETVDEW